MKERERGAIDSMMDNILFFSFVSLSFFFSSGKGRGVRWRRGEKKR
jgi:hypothetical protein